MIVIYFVLFDTSGALPKRCIVMSNRSRMHCIFAFVGDILKKEKRASCSLLRKQSNVILCTTNEAKTRQNCHSIVFCNATF